MGILETVVSQDKEVEMRKHVLALTTTAAILAYGANTAVAQAPGAETPGTQQIPMPQPGPGDHGMMGDHPGMIGDHPGMMGDHSGMMGHGMIGGAYGHHDLSRDREVMGPMMMRMIFSLMDADGDGKLSLQEFQAAHERIFKAMDANKDGFVSLEEMRNFLRGRSGPGAQ
jgi:EF hand domain-containing protein